MMEVEGKADAPKQEEGKNEQQENEQQQPQQQPNDNHRNDRISEEVSFTSTGPKYKPTERVYARDTSSGVWYEAIIRRTLFGINNNKQVVIGLVSNENEIEDALAQPEEPSWHYFVHYQKWAVNWDRWVSEDDIMPNTEQSKAKADRYMKEHKQLVQDLKKKKGRRGDGTVFLKEWRKRMDRIEEEIKKEQEEMKKKSGSGLGEPKEEGAGGGVEDKKDQSGQAASASEVTSKSTAKPRSKKAKKDVGKWDKATVEQEYKLRLKGLEGKRTSQQKLKIAMPFSLKKEMVEAWELITTCQMVANFPAKMTIKQALDRYLQSKLELIEKKTAPGSEKSANSEDKTATSNDAGDGLPRSEETQDKVEDEKTEEEKAFEKRKQEWIDMAEGIAMFFDDALSFRLLYREELPQYKLVESTFEVPIEVEATDRESVVHKATAYNMVSVASASGSLGEQNICGGAEQIETKSANAEKEECGQQGSCPEAKQAETKSTTAEETQKTRPMLPSEVYGCEHLLRLCLKLPDLLNEIKPKVTCKKGDEDGALAQEALDEYEKQTKQILAKVNDLIRFLHKHQSTMFVETYRKQNEAEQREAQKWIRYVERKRKRAMQDMQETSAAHEFNRLDTTGAADCEVDLPSPAKKPLSVEAKA